MTEMKRISVAFSDDLDDGIFELRKKMNMLNVLIQKLFVG